MVGREAHDNSCQRVYICRWLSPVMAEKLTAQNIAADLRALQHHASRFLLYNY